MSKHGYALHNLNPERDGSLGKVHRDLAAHEGRWEFVASQMAGDAPFEWEYRERLANGNYLPTLVRNTHMSKLVVGKAMEGTLVDLGCGPDIYLARMLYSNRRRVSKYIAVDYRQPAPGWKEPHFPLVKMQGDVTLWSLYEKIQAELEGKAPNMICTFEVIEHMAKDKGQAFIANIAKLAGPHTVIFASTPCHEDGKMPSEHIYEWHHNELKEEFEKHFTIVGNYGTFASQKDIKPVLTPAEREVWASLENYYDASYLSTIFAPNHPAESRNSLWVMQLKK
jgi:2-polyprenyl-3-methyl-5-hydroxy-6-metoxy-1,4-benzoquinol methylase